MCEMLLVSAARPFALGPILATASLLEQRGDAGHGWGVAWIADAGEPVQLYKRPDALASDPYVDTLADERAIAVLPEHFRIVLVARLVEEMSVEETADLLGLRHETVKTRLHRARALLRDDLERQVGPALTKAFPFAGARCERLADAVIKRLQAGESPNAITKQTTNQPSAK